MQINYLFLHAAKYKEFITIFLSVFESLCPHITPRYIRAPSAADDAAVADFNAQRCYKFMEAKSNWESDERYNQRMSAYVSFYAAITQFVGIGTLYLQKKKQY